MNELIKIETREIAGASVQTVNARELWTFVESKQDFSDWIKARIDKFGFIEEADYLVHKFMVNPKGGRPTLDYHLTVDMSKELAMVENNDKGREVRRYFIECEKRAKVAPAVDPMQVLSDPAAMRGLLLTYTEKVIALEGVVSEQAAVVAAQAPKVDAFDRIALADGQMNLQTAGKILQQPPNKFIQWLRENGWIYKRPGSKHNSAHVGKINVGYLTLKTHEFNTSDGQTRISEQVLVTPKGLAKLALMLGLPEQSANQQHGFLV